MILRTFQKIGKYESSNCNLIGTERRWPYVFSMRICGMVGA